MTSPATPLTGTAATLAERFNRAITVYLPPEDITLIERARDFAESLAGSPETMRDVLQTGIILADMHIIDAAGIAAGMLQHVAIDSKTHATIPDVIERIAVDFGPDTAYLIENIAHFVAIERRKGRRVTRPISGNEADGDRRNRERDERARRMQLETVRKMFVAMGNDPRVVVFRLAEQLRLLRDRNLPAEELIALGHEARDIYAPLAGRLGMARVESELEDLAFAVLEPEEYRRTANLVGQVRVEQRGYIEKVCAILAAEAEKNNITAEVSGRYKHMWSIYRKLVRNGWDIHQIYDLIAFRILIASEDDPAKDEKEQDREEEEKCYLMLGAVHALWQPKEDRIKDFIARPKPNGYRSLHTTVFCIDKRLAEIQIRTTRMHEDAEFGAAMHWHYKDVGDTARVDKRLTGWIQQLDDWKSDLEHRTTSSEFVASAKEEDGTRSQVFVFTPQGEVKDLPYGSTPVDFAYRIHTNLGDRCAGARVTMTGPVVAQRLVPLDYVLENGQIVEILTRKDAHPTRGWLKFARTHTARAHINRYLKQHERDIYITIGRDRFEREAKAAGLGDLEDISEEILRAVAEHLHYETVEELFAAIGGDTLRPSLVIQEITARIAVAEPSKKAEPAVPLPELPLPVTEARVNLAGAGGLLAHLANCCHPLPGDPIAGYISRGRGIVIHHQQCRSLKRMQEREADRLVPVAWEQMHLNRYDAPLIIIARDRTGLLRDVTQQVHEMKINMGSVSSVTGRRGKATITLTLQLTAKQHDDAQHKQRNKPPRGKPADDANNGNHATQNGQAPKAQEAPVRERAEDTIRRLLNEAIQRIRTIEGVENVDRDTRTLLPA